MLMPDDTSLTSCTEYPPADVAGAEWREGAAGVKEAGVGLAGDEVVRTVASWREITVCCRLVDGMVPIMAVLVEPASMNCGSMSLINLLIVQVFV